VQSKLRGLTGFEPVHVFRAVTHRPLKERIPNYLKTIAQFGPAKLDVVASEIDYGDSPPTCSECLRGGPDRWKRLVIDEDTWDGADIFYARGMGGVLMATQAFVDWALSNDIRDLTVEPALESGHDFYPWLRGNDT
jgi:hypothetical protein